MADVRSTLNLLRILEQLSHLVLQLQTSLPDEARSKRWLAVSLDSSEPDWREWILQLEQSAIEYRYFYDPVLKRHFLSVGSLKEFAICGENRFHAVEQEWQRWLRDIWRPSNCPLFVLPGFSFAPRHESKGWVGWPDAQLVLPQLLLMGNETSFTAVGLFEQQQPNFVLSGYWHKKPVEEQRLTVDALLEEFRNSVESKNAWERRVLHATEILKSHGDLEKVVLARLSLHATETLPSTAWKLLQKEYPDNFHFIFQHQGMTWLGASPERLLTVMGNRFYADALAGTERRGRTDKEDKAMGQALLKSRKNRQEHVAVVHYLQEKIQHICHHIQIPDLPILKKLANVQHLYTPVTAELLDGVSLADALKTLHPTPAVAGLPVSDALAYIRQEEPWARGWYAGALGWMDSEGNGSFAVALRSGLYLHRFIAVFAGAGIMSDSLPEEEWKETEMKMLPIRRAFGIF